MKRRKVKETLGILLALTFAVSTLAGCGSCLLYTSDD